MLVPVVLLGTACESAARLKKKPIFDYNLSSTAANSLSNHCWQPGDPIIKASRHGEKSSGITLRKPPEKCVRRYTTCPIVSMEVRSDWKCIMTSCKMLVPAAICAVFVGGAGVLSAYSGEELAKYAKVTLAEARAIALKAFPGKITDEELEKEKGGSGLRYSFDIKNGGVTHEVGVDAKTGKLLENSVEGRHAD